jgi:DNA (cytosine-5)-methyltransferase 1
MTAYYNEIDPAAAHVLRELIAADVIAPGVVDTRSIKDVSPDDLKGFTQCHFFAGGGLWSVAARLAGWPDNRPIWTGSCPCQPFSVAGKGAGADDPRHLWPDFFRLITASRPNAVVGEQVAGTSGYGWLDGVAADLAGEGYASGAVDIPACAVDAPHIRQRLYWCALDHGTSERRREGRAEYGVRSRGRAAACTDAQGPLGDGISPRLEGYTGHGDAGRGSLPAGPVAAPDGRNGDFLHADANSGGCSGRQEVEIGETIGGTAPQRDLPRVNGSFWSDADWITCHDGKARRTKPGLRLLADGAPRRVDQWRIAGNAIVPQLAAQVLGALMDITPEWLQ